MPDPYLVLTLGLPYPLHSVRAAAMTEPWPGRWTVHIVLAERDEVDDELLAWVKDAWQFACAK